MNPTFSRRRILKWFGACGAAPWLGWAASSGVPKVVVDFQNPIGKTDPRALGYNVEPNCDPTDDEISNLGGVECRQQIGPILKPQCQDASPHSRVREVQKLRELFLRESPSLKMPDQKSGPRRKLVPFRPACVVRLT